MEARAEARARAREEAAEEARAEARANELSQIRTRAKAEVEAEMRAEVEALRDARSPQLSLYRQTREKSKARAEAEAEMERARAAEARAEERAEVWAQEMAEAKARAAAELRAEQKARDRKRTYRACVPEGAKAVPAMRDGEGPAWSSAAVSSAASAFAAAADARERAKEEAKSRTARVQAQARAAREKAEKEAEEKAQARRLMSRAATWQAGAAVDKARAARQAAEEKELLGYGLSGRPTDAAWDARARPSAGWDAPSWGSMEAGGARDYKPFDARVDSLERALSQTAKETDSYGRALAKEAAAEARIPQLEAAVEEARAEGKREMQRVQTEFETRMYPLMDEVRLPSSPALSSPHDLITLPALILPYPHLSPVSSPACAALVLPSPSHPFPLPPLSAPHFPQVRLLQASYEDLEAKNARLVSALEEARAEGQRSSDEKEALRVENAQLRNAAAVAEKEIYRSLQSDGFVPRYAHRHARPTR